MQKKAKLIIASSESNEDLYYATQFLAPDPFIYLEIDGRSIVVMSDLEIDRARINAKAAQVISYSKEAGKLKKNEGVNLIDVVEVLIKRKKIQTVFVAEDFSIAHADFLRERGIKLEIKKGLFFEKRLFKNKREIQHIRKVLSFTEGAIQKAINIIRQAKTHKKLLYYDGKMLTSEYLKKIIHIDLIENNCAPEHTIVACADMSCDPHCEGEGPILANQPIVIDVFPRHMKSRYFADMTRTVVKGKASAQLKKMYKCVLGAQEIAFERIRDGVDGSAIHKRILRYFEKKGFPAKVVRGRHQGFFHGTGHGVGLSLHEPPRISHNMEILKTSNVVTIEPGLYYPGVGGVRIEDMVVVRDNGVEILTKLEKVLEIE